MMWRFLLVVALLILALPQIVTAHALDPAYLELTTAGPQGWHVTWRIPDVAGHPMGLTANLPDGCTPQAGPLPVFDGRAWVTNWITDCPAGLAGGHIGIEGLEVTRTDALVRYESTPGQVQLRRLTAAAAGFDVPADAGMAQILRSYIGLGITHILEGVDHLLFVFVILLVVPSRRRLFWAITAFTLAHSITLAAASLGVLNLPPPPVEAVIALSIVFLAYELTLPPVCRDRLTQRAPWLVSFAFGLIHGLGFAGALREIGLPAGDIPLALFSFNIGVEIGQLLFIATVLLIGVTVRRLYEMTPATSRRMTLLASYGIGSLAAFWVIERVMAF
ncbi:MAG: HupE/UreJ family protein [Paracoccus sp. (in: a-proteobacteria)]